LQQSWPQGKRRTPLSKLVAPVLPELQGALAQPPAAAAAAPVHLGHQNPKGGTTAGVSCLLAGANRID